MEVEKQTMRDKRRELKSIRLEWKKKAKKKKMIIEDVDGKHN